MSAVREWIGQTFGVGAVVQEKLLTTFTVIVILWLLRRIILYVALKDATDTKTLFRWRKSTRYIAFTIALIVIGRVWFIGFDSLSTFLGLVSAGVAIALKDPLANIAGWFYILWWKPFDVGDRIQIGENSGDVIDLQTVQFTIMEIGNWVDGDQSTGRIIHIPNGQLFISPLANFTKGFPYLWNEVSVLVTFESNWKKAKEILDPIALRHTEEISDAAAKDIKNVVKKHMIYYSKFTPIMYTNVEDSGVKLSIRYLTRPRGKRRIQQLIWEDILAEFAKHDDIDFAYPTTRFYDNAAEGKVGARASG